MKRSGVMLGMGLLLVLGGAANALVLSEVDGTWGGVVGGSSVNFPTGVPVLYGNGSEDQVRWGTSTGEGQSGLGFTGIAPPDLSFDIGDPFEVGRLRHFNAPVAEGTAASAADLAVDLTFSDPAGLSKTFAFTLQIDETPNGAGPPPDDDYINFPASYAPETFDIGGTTYTLELLGFGSTPESIASQFQSPEGETNSTLLWGRITTPIPAPGAILLGALGATLVASLRRRRAL
jgi:hypothetical protein